jgi:hypothetical protein
MTYTGAIISRFLVSPNGEAAKKALLKVGGQCGKAENPAGAQHGAQQVGNQHKGAETAEDEHNQEHRVDLSVSLESNVYPLWSEYPQIEVREVQRSYNMTLTPVVPMAAGTGFGTGSSETTTTTPASDAKSKPVENQKADQDSDEKEATSAPTAPENIATGHWENSFAEVRAGLSEGERARVDEHSEEIIAEFAKLDQRAAQYAQQGNSQQAQQAARSQQKEAVAETNKHVSLLEVGCELSDSEPEKD